MYNASVITKSGALLNDQLLVGPMVHAPLLDVLLRFRRHRVALTTDVSRMYRAVMLPAEQRDLHRFVWRDNPNEVLADYRTVLSPEERTVMEHFQDNHYRNDDGRYVVPLPMKSNSTPLGESRSNAVQRFRWLERSLRVKGHFEEFSRSIHEYFVEGHAERIPPSEMDKPCSEVFYLPMPAVKRCKIGRASCRERV